MSRGANSDGLCFSYEKSANCRFGDDCRFVHSMAALKRSQNGGSDVREAGRRGSRRGGASGAGGRGGGRGGSRAGGDGPTRTRNRRNRGNAGGAGTVKSYECFQFRDSGKCEYGDECRFVHVLKTVGAERRRKEMENADGGGDVSGGGGSTKGGSPNARNRRNRRNVNVGKSQRAGDGEATEDDDGVLTKKQLRNQAFIARKRTLRRQRAAKRAAARAAGVEEAVEKRDNQCFQFRDNGECKYGEKCRFRHGDDDARPIRTPGGPSAGGGAGDDSKDGGGDSERPPRVKVDDICFQWHYSGSCKYADNCRFQHSAQFATEETSRLLADAAEAIKGGDAEKGTGEEVAAPVETSDTKEEETGTATGAEADADGDAGATETAGAE